MKRLVRVRLVGSSEDDIDEAIFVLVSAVAQTSAMLEMRSPRAGRRGEWLAYGRLSLADSDEDLHRSRT